MIPDGHKKNLLTLCAAAANGELALIECTDAVTGKPVITLCALSRRGGEVTSTPLAKMFDGNPYDELRPPKVDDDFQLIGAVRR